MALCAFAMCIQTYLLYKTDSIHYTLPGFVFAATLLSYNVHFYLASRKSSSSQQTNWFHQQKALTHSLNIVALIATVYFLLQLKELWIWVSMSVLLNAAYTAPLLFRKPLQLPMIFTLVKSYFIGFTWAVATVIFPIVLLKKEPGVNELVLFTHRFLLVSIATLLFDYRDRQRDFEQGVLTPANMLHEKQFHRFFNFNLLLFLLVTAGVVVLFPAPLQWLQFLLVFFFLWLHAMSRKRADDLFYLTWVDGSLFLSAVLSLFLLI